jgi:hypothetical protein
MITIPAPQTTTHPVEVTDRPQFSIEKDFTPHQPEPLQEPMAGPGC